MPNQQAVRAGTNAFSATPCPPFYNLRRCSILNADHAWPQRGARFLLFSQGMESFVTGLFSDEVRASEAVRQLVDAHFEPDEISSIAASQHGAAEIPVERTTGVPAGVAAGGALGAALGTAGAALVAVGTLPALPVALFAAGPILTALQGGTRGAAAGGLLGSLAGLGFWQTEPRLEHELCAGAALVGVRTVEGRTTAARAALVRAGARRLHVALAPSQDLETRRTS